MRAARARPPRAAAVRAPAGHPAGGAGRAGRRRHDRRSRSTEARLARRTAFVWTLDTVATLGSIPDPHDTGGQVVKVVLDLLGVGTLFYGLVTVAEFFVSGQLSGLLAERRTQKMIDALTDHYIICGFGRVGRQVARDLRAAGAAYVVIDPNPRTARPRCAAGVALHRGRGRRRRGARAGGDRARPRRSSPASTPTPRTSSSR